MLLQSIHEYHCTPKHWHLPCFTAASQAVTDRPQGLLGFSTSVSMTIVDICAFWNHLQSRELHQELHKARSAAAAEAAARELLAAEMGLKVQQLQERLTAQGAAARQLRSSCTRAHRLLATHVKALREERDLAVAARDEAVR